MNDSLGGGAARFMTTRWTLVAAAGHGSPCAHEALSALCQDYWYPLYAFIRRSGRSPQDAQDLTQAFLLDLIERDGFAVLPGKGRFRSYLLGALKHFLANDWHRGRAQKRGGGQALISWDAVAAEERYNLEPADERNPMLIYDRRWALEILERSLAQLRAEFAAKNQEPVFDTLKSTLTGASFDTDATAASLKMTTGAVKTAVHRLRQRYREIIRSEIADTVMDRAEIDEEMRHLIAVLRDGATQPTSDGQNFL